jgi:hypothetical protein
MRSLALGLLLSSPAAAAQEWTSLDADVNALTESLSAQSHGPDIGGWMATRFTTTSDVPPGSPDMAGFEIEVARVILHGQRGDYEYMLDYDFAANALEDAAIGFPCAAGIHIHVGRIGAPIGTSGELNDALLFFPNRTFSGEGQGALDTGVRFYHQHGSLHSNLSVTNGSDGTADEYLVAGRLSYDLTGNGALLHSEGAYDGPESVATTASVSYFDDGGVAGSLDADGLVLDVRAVTNVYSVAVEWMDVGDALSTFFPAAGPGAPGLVPRSTPWNAQGTWRASQDWELGLRIQELDDSAQTSVLDFAASRTFPGEGRDLSWTLGWTRLETSAALGGDVDTLLARLLIIL